MERLPYIDEYAIAVPAGRAATWAALLTAMCRDPANPTTVPRGFVLDEAVPTDRFALKGRHFFARYRLIFLLSDIADEPDQTRLTAQTWAAFPGIKGRIYRGLVIGSGGHLIVCRLMLKRIAALADKQGHMSTP